MVVKVWNYLDEYREDHEEIHAAIERVLSSGTLILGPSVAAFEKEFADFCGVTYGVGVDNATNGLFLVLRAAGVGPGDEVITVPNTAVPTVTAIVQSGARPRFVDIDYETGLMDVQAVSAAITSKTRCIIPVHLYGQCVDMDPLLEVARSSNILVLEDCSQAHGAQYGSAMAGSMGDLAVFSFYPTKPLGGYGDGGMIVTNNPDFEERLRRLRFYGMSGEYRALGEGYNSRLDELQAEILRVKLRKLSERIQMRRKIASLYDSIFADSTIRPVGVSHPSWHCYFVYAVRHPQRDEILVELQKEGIELNSSYRWPIHTMPGFVALGYSLGDFPNSERLCAEVFSMPMYPHLNTTIAEEVANRVLRFDPGNAT